MVPVCLGVSSSGTAAAAAAAAGSAGSVSPSLRPPSQAVTPPRPAPSSPEPQWIIHGLTLASPHFGPRLF